MILWPQNDGSILATPQPAHALIAGQLMRRLADRPDPFEPVVNAATQHDCAWLPWEAEPEFDAATHLPRAFNALKPEEHVPLWEKGVALALANWGLWEALLLLRHGSHIYRLGDRVASSERDREATEGYFALERERGAEWMRRLGVTEAEVAPLSAKLAMVDGIALSLCWGKAEFDCAGTALRRAGDFTATLDPWPLDAPEVTVTTTALRLPGPFADEAAMRAALPVAPREALRFTLRAAA